MRKQRARRMSSSPERNWRHWNDVGKGYERRRRRASNGRRRSSALLCRSHIWSLPCGSAARWWLTNRPRKELCRQASSRNKAVPSIRPWATFRRLWLQLGRGLVPEQHHPRDQEHPRPRDHLAGILRRSALVGIPRSATLTSNMDIHRQLLVTSRIRHLDLHPARLAKIPGRAPTARQRLLRSRHLRYQLSAKDLLTRSGT